MKFTSLLAPESWPFRGLLFMLAVAVVYWPVLDAYFVLDDQLWIDRPSAGQLLNYFHNSWGHGSAYRPLVRVSFAVDAFLFGDNPTGWHWHNMLLHALNGTLLYQLLVRWIPQGTVNRVLLCLACLVFITAPSLHTNISWISARTHTLAVLFFFLSLLYLQRGFDQDRTHPAAVVCFILAMMCYEPMAVLPFFTLALFWAYLLSGGNALKVLFRWHSYYRTIAVLFASMVVFLLLRAEFLGQATVRVSRRHEELSGWLLSMAKLYGSVVVYNFSVLVILLVSVLYLGRYHRSTIPPLLLASLAIAAPYLPSYGIDFRYTYLLTAFYLACLSMCLLWYVQQIGRFHGLAGAALVFALLLNSFVSHKHAQYWRESGDIAQHILEQTRLELPSLPDDQQLNFIGIPSVKNHAGIYLTYFDLALKRHFGALDSSVKIVWDSRLINQPHLHSRIKASHLFFLYRDGKMRQVNLDAWKASPEYQATLPSAG